jgi:hypothetical protein
MMDNGISSEYISMKREDFAFLFKGRGLTNDDIDRWMQWSLIPGRAIADRWLIHKDDFSKLQKILDESTNKDMLRSGLTKLLLELGGMFWIRRKEEEKKLDEHNKVQR